MKTLRTFLAISIPSSTEFPAMVERLKKNLQHEKYINYVKTNQIHLTLKFLGNTPEEDVPAIIESCQKVAKNHKPFTMDFDRTGLFGSNHSPRVLWLGMNEQPKALFDLEADLLDAFDDLGYLRDRQNFVHTSPFVASSSWLTNNSLCRSITPLSKRPISMPT